MSRKILVSAELLWRLTGWQLRRDWVWLLIGIGGGLLAAMWLVVKPFDLREMRELVFREAQLLAAWSFGLSLLYACAGWLAPKAARQDSSDELALPVSRLQLLLNQSIPGAVVPLLTGLACLAWFSVALVYAGVPYNAGYNYSGELSSSVLWWLRMASAAGNIFAGSLLALAWGQALETLCSWRPLRVIIALGVPVGLVFLMHHVEYEFFYICYRQTRGYEPYVFILIPAVLILLPGVLAWLWHPWRQIAMTLLMMLAGALIALPFVQYQLPGENTTAMLRELLGDWRFGLAYYAGHLNPWLNIEYIDRLFLTNVLLDDHLAGNLIPRHVPLWWGAAMYPLLLPIVVLLTLGMGKLLRPLRHREL